MLRHLLEASGPVWGAPTWYHHYSVFTRRMAEAPHVCTAQRHLVHALAARATHAQVVAPRTLQPTHGVALPGDPWGELVYWVAPHQGTNGIEIRISTP